MDILKDLKEFILQDGLKTWIEKFRNPDEEVFYYCEVKYDPNTDSRIYYYEEEHPEYYTYALSGASKEVSIDTALKSYLTGRLIAFEKEVKDLLFLVIDNLPLLKELISRCSDFTMLRYETKKVSPLPALTDLLIIHIGKIEFAYNDFITKARVNANMAYSNSLAGDIISLENKENGKFKCHDAAKADSLLKKLYDSLIRHECISPAVKLIDFKKAFGMNGNLDSKIIWKATQPSLYYFIQKLFEYNFLDSSGEKRKWKITQAWFCGEDGEDISKFMNTLKSSVTEDDTKLIEKVLLSIKKG